MWVTLMQRKCFCNRCFSARYYHQRRPTSQPFVENSLNDVPRVLMRSLFMFALYHHPCRHRFIHAALFFYVFCLSNICPARLANGVCCGCFRGVCQRVCMCVVGKGHVFAEAQTCPDHPCTYIDREYLFKYFTNSPSHGPIKRK